MQYVLATLAQAPAMHPSPAERPLPHSLSAAELAHQASRLGPTACQLPHVGVQGYGVL
jgi:hypothetical protein